MADDNKDTYVAGAAAADVASETYSSDNHNRTLVVALAAADVSSEPYSSDNHNRTHVVALAAAIAIPVVDLAVASHASSLVPNGFEGHMASEVQILVLAWENSPWRGVKELDHSFCAYYFYVPYDHRGIHQYHHHLNLNVILISNRDDQSFWRRWLRVCDDFEFSSILVLAFSFWHREGPSCKTQAPSLS